MDHSHDSYTSWDDFAKYVASCRRIVCLLGAGLSAPSGLQTWRGTGGLWNGIHVKELASPYKFKEDPVLVWRFYGERMLEALAATPNAAHYALARIAEGHEGWLTINQNIDGKLEGNLATASSITTSMN